MTWRDLLIIVKRQPTTSALAQELRGEAGGWQLEHYFMAAQLNVLRALSWQQAGKGPKPKPVLPPGREPEDQTAFKGRGMTIEELNQKLGWTTPIGSRP